jgi:hypothetical protein
MKMLTITEIRSALEAGKMLIGTDVVDNTSIKAVLGMDSKLDTDGEARILINCLEVNGYQWGNTCETYHADFGGCGWFTNPEYYVWTGVTEMTDTLPEGLVLGGELEECEEGTDNYSNYRYEQRGMGLPK